MSCVVTHDMRVDNSCQGRLGQVDDGAWIACTGVMPSTVKEIMNRELLTVRPETSAREARDLLRGYAIGAAPVVDESHCLLGVVSVRDLLDATGPVAQCMTRPAVCVGSSASISAAARQLALSDRHHLVVVDGAGSPVGMISTLDALRALLDLPARHPKLFPHWDEATQTSWTDDWLLDEDNVMRAPQGPGVLVLTTGHLGETDAIVWAEPCDDVRARARELVRSPKGQSLALARVLCLCGLRFRAAASSDGALAERVASLLRDRIEHAPPPGAT